MCMQQCAALCMLCMRSICGCGCPPWRGCRRATVVIAIGAPANRHRRQHTRHVILIQAASHAHAMGVAGVIVLRQIINRPCPAAQHHSIEDGQQGQNAAQGAAAASN